MPRLAVLVYAASAFSVAAPCFLVDSGQLLGLMVSIFGADIMVFFPGPRSSSRVRGEAVYL